MQRAVVLSDLHLGPGGVLTTFRDPLALAGLFHRLADEAAAIQTELVLAGDVFDFLQSDGYAGFDAAKAPERLQKILAAPGNASVFQALAAFGAVPGAEITVLSGNHDPEMLLAPVREVFERAVKRPGSVRWADDDPPLRPRDGDKWPLLGRALGDPSRGQVWITHGDRWDPHNAIDRDAVRSAVAQGRPVALPPGSHFVFEVMAKLKPGNRWVDEMKPELPLVLPLLYYLDARRTRAVAAKHWRLSGELVRGVVTAALRTGDLFGEAEAAPAPRAPDVPRDLGGLLAHELRDVPPAQRDVLLAELSDVIDGAPARAPDGDTLAAHGGVGKLLLRAWMAGIRRSDRFHAEDGPDDIPYHAGPMLSNGVVGLVAGHTHGPRWIRDKRPAYVNTGTWIPVGSLPQGDVDAVIDALEGGRWEAHAPRSFAVVEVGDGPPAIRLARCDERGAEVPQ